MCFWRSNLVANLSVHVKLESRIKLRYIHGEYIRTPILLAITVRRTGHTETLQYMLFRINSLYIE